MYLLLGGKEKANARNVRNVRRFLLATPPGRTFVCFDVLECPVGRILNALIARSGSKAVLRCVIENDEVNELLQARVEAGAILLGSPTFFADLTSEMKALIDRAGFVALKPLPKGSVNPVIASRKGTCTINNDVPALNIAGAVPLSRSGGWRSACWCLII